MRCRQRSLLWVLLDLVIVSTFARPSLAGWPNDPSVNLPISTSPFSHTKPQIAQDGAGGAIIVWEDVRLMAPDSVFGDIYAQRVSGAGEIVWAADGVSVGLPTQGQGPYQPQLVSDGDFGAIVAWEDHRSGVDLDIYAQRIDPFGGRMWHQDGVPICTATNDQNSIQMIPDGEGGAILTWVDFRGGPYSDIYAQRVDGFGSVLWTLDGVAVATVTRDQEKPRLVTDGAGGAIVVWQDERTTVKDIYAQRIDASGTALWTTNGVAICAAADHQEAPDLTVDDAGGAIISWRDRRPMGDPNDIYAQRVNANGTPLWLSNGIAVCTANEAQDRPRLLADGQSGAYICWADSRGGNADIYAQRVDSLGASLWTFDGIPVSPALRVQFEPEIIQDGQGGAIVTWSDSRTEVFSTDVYAQRVGPSGDSMWTAGGVPISTAPDFQYLPQLVPDWQGGAIIAWEDHRAGIISQYDVYVQQVDCSGQLGVVPAGIPTMYPRSEALAVLPNVPNPFTVTTQITFVLTSPSRVSVDVYDAAGRLVFHDQLGNLPKGLNRYRFRGNDASGTPLPSGVYFYGVRTGSEFRTRKFVVVR